jgi:imidazole glycerol-phosphate synthase subunit HisF
VATETTCLKIDTKNGYMRRTRLIARLDIKGPNLIKGIHLEGLRVIGSPNEYALKYYKQGADELIYMDCVASLYGRNSLDDIIQRAVRDVFVPITVGGGIRSVEDATNILRCGADKVAINTAAVANPKLISNISRYFGSQCMVLSIEAKQLGPDQWEVYTDNGRERTGLDVIDWAKKGVDLGAGEILLTSVDREGTRKGFDTPLIRAVTQEVSVPVIASGGMGKPEDLIDAVHMGEADAVAMADILHYNRATVGDICRVAQAEGIQVRDIEYV